MEKARQYSALAGLILYGLLASPALAGDAYWQASGGPGQLAIAHIPDESDNFAIDLTCRRGRIEVTIPVADDDRSGRIRLISGVADLTYSVRYDDNELGRFAMFIARSKDPVLLGFRGTGRISIGRYRLDAASSKEREAITRFFRRCDRFSYPQP